MPVAVVLRARRLPVSPGKGILRVLYGPEPHFRHLYGTVIDHNAVYHHVVPVLAHILLGAERRVPARKLERRKPANHSRARGESDQNAGRSSSWVLVLLVSYCGHRPDRYEQWCTNPTATSVLLVRIINLHVLGYKPGVVWAHEPIVSRRIQTNHHLQDCGVKLSMLPT